MQMMSMQQVFMRSSLTNHVLTSPFRLRSYLKHRFRTAKSASSPLTTFRCSATHAVSHQHSSNQSQLAEQTKIALATNQTVPGLVSLAAEWADKWKGDTGEEGCCREEQEEPKGKMGGMKMERAGEGQSEGRGQSEAGNETVLQGNRGEKDFDHSALSLASLAPQ